MKSFLLWLVTISLFCLPILADGVNKKKKKRAKAKAKVTKTVKKPKIVRNIKKKPVVSRFRAKVRNLYPKIVAEPISENTSPRVPYEISCSENKFVFLKVYGIAIEFSEGETKIYTADYKTHKRVVEAEDSPSSITYTVALVFADQLKAEQVIMKQGKFIFVLNYDLHQVNFDSIRPAIRKALPGYYPFEVGEHKYGCPKSAMAFDR